MGKFFNGKVKNNRETLVKYGVIGGGVLIILILLIVIVSVNGNRNKAVVTLNKNVKMQINGTLPTKEDYFKEYKNYDINSTTIDTSSVDVSKVGEYTVNVKVSGKTQQVTLTVYDDEAPVLELEDVKIIKGASYKAEDFVSSCKDNSKEECIISFYSDAQDQDGNLITFDGYEDEGTYTVQIVAYDKQNNMSSPKTATLTIRDESSPENPSVPPVTPVSCDYGNLDIPSYVDYPVAVIVGDEVNNCALDRNLFDNETAQKKVNEVVEYDNTRLKNQMDAIKSEYTNGAKIVVYPYKIAIFNKELTGLIGYAVYVKVYVASANAQGDINTEENLKLAYYINSDKTRKYDINIYNFS